MPTYTKNAPRTIRWDSDIGLLAWLATCISVVSFLYYFQRGDVLLYGDAVAHINIARRVFDSKTPGLLQLGTVWLPLPHLLMIPFLISDYMWQRGAGGSIPSLVAYGFAVVGMFRLVRSTLSAGAVDRAARVAAWTAALIFAANPNLIYMQTTAMGEAIYLALFLWTLVYFADWLGGKESALTKGGLCLAAACLTRYDAWLLAVIMAVGAPLLAFLARSGNKFGESGSSPSQISTSFRPAYLARFILIAAAAPALWLSYNAIVYRNPLEFANGPYSAKAIEARTQNPDHPGHPGSGSPVVAGLYFLKAAQASVAENGWLQRAWVLLAALGFVAAIIRLKNQFRRCLPILLLLIPLCFYALSIAYGGVPIFVPAWWPFTLYNVRYGLQLLPALCAGIALLVYFVLRIESLTIKLRAAGLLAVFAFVVASYASVWRATPVSLKEAQVNMRTRNQLEMRLAVLFEQLPPNATLLMYLGDHVGALQHAGIPLKRVVNEGNHRVWKKPTDPEGLWERALADPSAYVDYVVAFEGDPVWNAMQGRKLPALIELHVSGQARAVLYRAR